MVEVARHIGPEHAFLAPSEIASAIGCTDRQAEGRLELATDLAGRLPGCSTRCWPGVLTKSNTI